MLRDPWRYAMPQTKELKTRIGLSKKSYFDIWNPCQGVGVILISNLVKRQMSLRDIDNDSQYMICVCGTTNNPNRPLPALPKQKRTNFLSDLCKYRYWALNTKIKKTHQVHITIYDFFQPKTRHPLPQPHTKQHQKKHGYWFPSKKTTLINSRENWCQFLNSSTVQALVPLQPMWLFFLEN